MKILSLFDGISVAQQALKNIKIIPNLYFASEIDKYAIQITQKNFPNTLQIGDVRSVKGKDFENIDLLIGGSPCQDLSIAKHNRQGLNGEKSSLFWEYVRLLKEIKPKFFILENVASMSKESKQTITETLGVEPVMLNAALVSAQQRKRLFWVGKLVGKVYEKIDIVQPYDRKIYLQDILEDDWAIKEKAYCSKSNYLNASFSRDFIQKHQGNFVFKKTPDRISELAGKGQAQRIYSTQGKSICLSANGGGLGAKTGLYLITGAAKRTRVEKGKQLEIRHDGKTNSLNTVNSDSMVVIRDMVRTLTPIECERLQSLPDNFTEGVSKTQRLKALGNSFNCAVIEHILKELA